MAEKPEAKKYLYVRPDRFVGYPDEYIRIAADGVTVLPSGPPNDWDMQRVVDGWDPDREVRVDDDADGFPRTVNHRMAAGGENTCRSCKYVEDDTCLMWENEPVTKPTEVCDAWTENRS